MLRHQLFVYFLRNSVNHSFKKLPGAVEATFGRCQKRFQKNTFLCLSAAPRRRVQRHSAERRSAERHSPQLRHSPEAFCRMPAFGAVPPSAVLRDAARLNVAASCLLAMKNSHHFETFPRSEQNNSFRVKSNKKRGFSFFRRCFDSIPGTGMHRHRRRLPLIRAPRHSAERHSATRRRV